MHYPIGLSADQKNRVERARDLAEIDLRTRLKEPNPHRLNLARDFIFSIFRVLSRQIAEAERDGGFHGAAGRTVLEHFVQFELVPHAYELSDIRHYYIGFQDFPIAQFRAKLLEQLKASDLWTEYLRNRLAAWSEVPKRQVTAQLIARRGRLVRSYRSKQGFTIADFERHAGMSDSAIRGVVKEDRSRYNDDSQAKLLTVLGVTIDDWYRLEGE